MGDCCCCWSQCLAHCDDSLDAVWFICIAVGCLCGFSSTVFFNVFLFWLVVHFYYSSTYYQLYIHYKKSGLSLASPPCWLEPVESHKGSVDHSIHPWKGRIFVIFLRLASKPACLPPSLLDGRQCHRKSRSFDKGPDNSRLFFQIFAYWLVLPQTLAVMPCMSKYSFTDLTVDVGGCWW